jgi:hypothetical protein
MFSFIKSINHYCIFKRYISLKKELKEILLKAKYLAFTTDLWIKKINKYFLALTVHFFDEDLVYHSLLFSFRKFSKLHFAKTIRDVIIKEIGNESLKKIIKF